MGTWFIGVDIGGTRCRVGALYSEAATSPIEFVSFPTGAITPDQFLAGIQLALAELSSRLGLDVGAAAMGVGIACAGPIAADLGITNCVNLPNLRGVSLYHLLKGAFVTDLPLRLALDAQCLALAEARLGRARMVGDSMAVTISTGVGSGLILRGELVRGSSGNAGHFGQMLAPGEGGVSIEEVASAPNTLLWAQRRGFSGPTPESLASAARAGDRVAKQACSRSARAVGSALAGVSALLELEMITLHGGFARGVEGYDVAVYEAYRSACILPTQLITTIDFGMHRQAGLVGACLLFADVFP